MKRRQRRREAQYESATYIDLQERVAANCRRLRKKADLTQEDIAHKAGMSTRLYQRIENCEANLTFTTVARLGDGFAVDVSEIFARRRGRTPT